MRINKMMRTVGRSVWRIFMWILDLKGLRLRDNYTVQLVTMDRSKYRQFTQSGYEPPTFVVTKSL